VLALHDLVVTGLSYVKRKEANTQSRIYMRTCTGRMKLASCFSVGVERMQ
jgi:hypothetical protein